MLKDECPFKIYDRVQTATPFNVGTVIAFHWEEDDKDWKIIVKFNGMSLNIAFNSQSIRLATRLEILLYA